MFLASLASRAAAGTPSAAALRRTPLYDLHVKSGGQMVDYAGWSMPVQFKATSALAEHKATREGAALYDVSHMEQLVLRGSKAPQFLEKISGANYTALTSGSARLGVMCNERGGIIDDFMSTRDDDTEATDVPSYYIVVNAGCAAKDVAHMRQQIAQFDKTLELRSLTEEYALLALQGPQAYPLLRKLVPKHTDDFWESFKFMTRRFLKLPGVQEPVRVTRCGYTGEDGFELAVPAGQSIAVAQTLVEHGATPAGLAARDVSRLEAGLCLYGNDMDETITPVEAQLMWLIPKARRLPGSFIGSELILKQLADGPARKRVGLLLDTGIARPGHDGEQTAVLSGAAGASDVPVGHLCSGTFSPVLKKGVGMAYVPPAHAADGTPLRVVVRGKPLAATVVKMPFVPARYHK